MGGRAIKWDDEWILEHHQGRFDYKHLTAEYNATHSEHIPIGTLARHCRDVLGLFKCHSIDYSDDELEFIRQFYRDLPTKDFMQEYNERFDRNRSTQSVQHKASLLGIKKLPELRNKAVADAHTRKIGEESTYHDKGGYWKIKTPDGKWKRKHVYLWEQANGPVPKGHAIMFLDGDSSNCVLENLICVPKSYLVYMNRMFKNEDADPATRPLKFRFCELYDELRRKKEEDND